MTDTGELLDTSGILRRLRPSLVVDMAASKAVIRLRDHGLVQLASELSEAIRGNNALKMDAAVEIEKLTARVKALEAALTPSAATKAAYIAEFTFNTEQWDDEAGEDGEGAVVIVPVTVPWTTVKEVMRAIMSFAECKP